MERYSTAVLRFAIFIAGAMVLGICGGAFWLATRVNSEYVALSYAFLIGTCLAAIPFFTALCQSYKLLGYIDTGCVFSELSVNALRSIRRSAFIEFLICSLGGLPFFYIVAKKDDAPGLVIIGMMIVGVAFVIFVFASVLNRVLQDAIAMKSENDLTV